MIGKLSGTLVEKSSDCIVLDVTGVGYEVEVPASSLCLLPALGEAVALSVHTHVREDSIRLFGFVSRADRTVFEMLLSVTNVGPKLALALMGPFEGTELCRVILDENLAALTSVPGVGARTAERLIVELRSKAQKVMASLTGAELSKTSRSKTAAGHTLSTLIDERWTKSNVVEDVRSALQNLGYKDKQIAEVIAGLEKRSASGENIVLEMALKEALRQLSGHLLGRSAT
ncbi:Holliday junction branch migration protein RuvA [bacterium]|nr:Holliday junction branch migration protein RuvA [bacterium]